MKRLTIHLWPRLDSEAAYYISSTSPPWNATLSLSTQVSLEPSSLSTDLQDFKLDVQHVIEVDEGNTAVIACHLPESHPKAQVRYSVKQEWLEASRGKEWAGTPRQSPGMLAGF